MIPNRRRRRKTAAGQGTSRPARPAAPWLCLVPALLAWPLAAGRATAVELTAAPLRVFEAQGVVKALNMANRTMRIAHEAITNYMPAMTMPFHIKEPALLNTVSVGDKISFRLHVTEQESWIDGIRKIGVVAQDEAARGSAPTTAAQPPPGAHPLRFYHFTNELGQAVSLADFRGQALAITFFFTRCPIPDFCPRLSKNFEEASAKLKAMPNAPTNWHFISVTFDPAFDTPSVLRAYAKRYGYDPAHWSFFTGPVDKITELAQASDVQFTPDSGLLTHNFRTLIIDAAGHLQMVFPTGGNLSEAIVTEVLKATQVAGGPS